MDTTVRPLIESILQSILAGRNIELVEFQYNTGGKRSQVRVFLDKPGGITISECSQVARELSVRFQVEETLPSDIQIEVSSPGIDRPLKTVRDFERNLGRELNVRYQGPDRELETTGKLVAAGPDAITLLGKNGETVIPQPVIRLAKQHIHF